MLSACATCCAWVSSQAALSRWGRFPINQQCFGIGRFLNLRSAEVFRVAQQERDAKAYPQINPAVCSLLHIGVEDAILFQVVGHRVLGQKRRLQADFGADPFAFAVRLVGCVIAAAPTAKLRPEVGGLDLLEMIEFSPGCIANGARDVDLQLEDGHFVPQGLKPGFLNAYNAAPKGQSSTVPLRQNAPRRSTN